ncbi:MAG: DUF4301 family protein [Bdellovibrionota bacterium]
MNLLNDTFIKSHGLNARRIRLHQRRILQALRNEINTEISIKNACSVQDGSIIAWNIVAKILSTHTSDCLNWQQNHLVGCIPAAGAASRFFLELQHFVNAVRQQIEQNLELNPLSLQEQFAFLPSLVRHAGHPNVEYSSILVTYDFCCNLIENYSLKPKLIVPATLEGDTFLKLKIEEQINLISSLGTTLVVPNSMKKEIQQILYQLKPKEYEKWLVLEQDNKLSTVRFLRNGEPLLDENGKYSIVSAGHGELLHIFDNIADNFPQAHCLHIRNIDNIIGTTQQRKQELNIPTNLFYNLRKILEAIRKKIPCINFHSPTIQDKELSEMLLFISKIILPNEDFRGNTEINCKSMYNLFSKLFHWQPLAENMSNIEIWKLILENCERPLSVLGVVKKEKGDVGGGPVFAKVSDGNNIKLCMEMPHATPEDAKEFFSDTGKTAYFNPVLVFFELRTHTNSNTNTGKKVNFVQLFDERFWLLSKREYKGIPVCYHETVLYELIGNSATTNLVFVEVPRSLFKPHKSYLDCLEQNRESYGFNKNFEP